MSMTTNQTNKAFVYSVCDGLFSLQVAKGKHNVPPLTYGKGGKDTYHLRTAWQPGPHRFPFIGAVFRLEAESDKEMLAYGIL